MKNIALLIACAAISAMAIGCASIQTAMPEDMNNQRLSTDKAVKNIAHINAYNWGLYFLWFPLLSGDVDNPGSIAVGKDTVKVAPVVKMLTAKSKELGANTTDNMNSYRNSFMLPFPFPFLFYLQEVEVNGNAVVAP